MAKIFDSQNEMGRLADECVYQADAARRLRSAGMGCDVEVPILLEHKGFSKRLFLDLVVVSKAVYEFKTVAALNARHEAQLLTYLYLLNLPRGKLVNFRSPRVDSRFVNAPIPREERCNFSVDERSFHGPAALRDTVIDLVRDWGTCLSVSLYLQAMIFLHGGEEKVRRMLPVSCGGVQLGRQRFHLHDLTTHSISPLLESRESTTATISNAC